MLVGVAVSVPLCLALVGAPASAAPAAEVSVVAAHGEKVAGQYIVTLKSGASVGSVTSAASVKPLFTYRAALHGFAAKLSTGQLQSLQRNSGVARIEQDQVAHATTTQSSPTWGLDRTDEHYLPMDAKYTYTYTGYKIRAYVIDTGIQANHPQFGGRALAVYDAVGDGQNGNDCNGHGTHVAGTIGSTTYGVAKRAYLRAVRVLDCTGSGSYAGVIAGVDYVTANHVGNAVANMSLGGGYSQDVNDAVTAMVNSGVFTSVAAGNSSANACDSTPASASAVMTVAASDKADASAYFTNYGSCVETYAPGVDIKSTWIGSTTNTISGTSMASPHVAGVAALYREKYATASQFSIFAYILNATTKGQISGIPDPYTPNRLLYKVSTL